jgi:hypothetical protein
MTESFMAGAPIVGLETPGTIPAGMLRIHKDNQERYVWPVHLPGWLGLGWRIAGSVSDPADGALNQLLTPAVVAPEPDPEPTPDENGPEPATGRGKRGRRRKEEEQSPAGDETPPAAIGTAAEQGSADADQPAVSEWTGASTPSMTEPAAAPVSEPVASESAATAPAAENAAALSALPDDLFSDPLI